MKKILLRVTVAVVLAVGAYLTWILVSFGLGAYQLYDKIWGEDTSHLPQVAISELVDLDAAEYIVFRDGRDGWYLIETPTEISSVDIGFHGDRFFEALFSTGHRPMYCGGDRGKILWGIAANQRVEELAFCNTNRMGLDNLHAFAEPVEMIDEDLPSGMAQLRLDEIDQNPRAKWVSRPDPSAHFSHEQEIMLPYIWSTDPDDLPSEQELARKLTAHAASQTGVSSDAFKLTLSLKPTVNDMGNNTPLVSRDEKVLQLSLLAQILHSKLTLSCSAAECTALTHIDYTPVMRGYRPDILDQAFGQAAEYTEVSNKEPLRENALRSPVQQAGPLRETTFKFQHIIQRH